MHKKRDISHFTIWIFNCRFNWCFWWWNFNIFIHFFLSPFHIIGNGFCSVFFYYVCFTFGINTSSVFLYLNWIFPNIFFSLSHVSSLCPTPPWNERKERNVVDVVILKAPFSFVVHHVFCFSILDGMILGSFSFFLSFFFVIMPQNKSEDVSFIASKKKSLPIFHTNFPLPTAEYEKKPYFYFIIDWIFLAKQKNTFMLWWIGFGFCWFLVCFSRCPFALHHCWPVLNDAFSSLWCLVTRKKVGVSLTASINHSIISPSLWCSRRLRQHVRRTSKQGGWIHEAS